MLSSEHKRKSLNFFDFTALLEQIFASIHLKSSFVFGAAFFVFESFSKRFTSFAISVSFAFNILVHLHLPYVLVDLFAFGTFFSFSLHQGILKQS